jgi:Dolichyl-phosphate-mannose-protein mannosyltransferase
MQPILCEIGRGIGVIATASAEHAHRWIGFLRSNWSAGCLIGVLIGALAMGLYGRFAGLGLWAFGVDEFYISRSIDHVLNTGLPKFLCGGYYTRGLVYQYVVALVRHWSVSPEFAGRVVSAVWSLMGLPAAYLIGRRLGGRTLGLTLLIVLSASVWEIEMARFARMYAPFQSVFLWYLVFFLKYTVDRVRSALMPMVLLSILGVLTWEGGALLGLANLLPPLLNHERGRLRRRDFKYIIAMLILFGALVAATTDLRGSAGEAAVSGEQLGSQDSAAPLSMDLQVYTAHGDWIAALVILQLALSFRAVPWIWAMRARWLAAAGLGVALLGAWAHQFALCGASIALLLLTELVAPADLKARGARAYALALLVCCAFWPAFGVLTGAWRKISPDDVLTTHLWLGLAQHLGGFPRVFDEILRPWGKTLPVLSVGVSLLGAALAALVIFSRRLTQSAVVIRTLMALLLVLMLAVGARAPGRIETRYTFFLYPLVMALGLAGILGLVESRLGKSQAALAAGAALGLLFFGLSEDFKPAHIAHIASWRVNFRVGMTPSEAAHFYPRSDYRMAAMWLKLHARPEDEVIIGIPSLDPYYRANYFFLQSDDDRYDDYACRGGTEERWTNLPLLYGTDALAARVASRRVFLVIYPEVAQAMLAEGRQRPWRERLAWLSPDGGIAVTAIDPGPQATDPSAASSANR